MVRVALLALLGAGAGCVVGGTRAQQFRPAMGAEGIHTRLQLTDGTVLEGELLADQDSALLLRIRGDTLALVPLALLRSASFDQVRSVRDLRRLRPDQRRELRLLARYPAGVTPDLLERLLRAYGQPEVKLVGAASSLEAGAESHGSEPARGTGQADARAVDAFVSAARAAALPYRDLNVAIAAGFRRVGGDLPAMGEHWVHPGRVVSGGLDVAEPAMLAYYRAADGPRLAGVVYAVPVGPGEAPPGFPAASAWHTHAGKVDDEAMLHTTDGRDAEGTVRLALLHVWLAPENPAGPFAPDNWAIPYARLGIAAPGDAPAQAAMALSLGGAGSAHVAATLRTVVRDVATEAELAAIGRVVAAHRQRVDDWLEPASRRALGGDDVVWLTARWDAFWRDVLAEVGPAARARLAAYRDATRTPHH